MMTRFSLHGKTVATTVCYAMCATTMVAATESQLRDYNLPAGDAVAMLKQFAADSGQQIVYMIDNVRGEKTNSVTGRFVPLEALERMLMGTTLFASKDVASGALVVGRRPSPSSGAGKPDTAPPTARKTAAAPARWFAPLAGWFAAAAGLRAQTTGAATGAIEGRVLNAGNGAYLSNARVTVDGAKSDAFTDASGYYALTGVPVGRVNVKVFYTGMGQRVFSITVNVGQTATLDVSLAPGAAAARDDGAVLQLDQFVVAAARETNASAIATNEQRFARNIKNVVSADAFGDVTEGNVGEFVKFLPGVTIDYVGADPRTISVRGFSDIFTAVSMDGGRMASAVSGESDRVFELEQVSISNLSRVEVTKVPLPEMSAASLGGNVNMISRSAFERAEAQFSYRVYASVNDENLDFGKTPGPTDKRARKILPGFDFNYIAPLSGTFGLVINGLTSNQFNEQHVLRSAWNFDRAGATAENPYFQNMVLQDSPKITRRHSLSLKADWKFAPRHLLSASVQTNYYESFFGNRSLTFDAGANNVPTPANGTPLAYGPTFTQGATGRGSVIQTAGAFRNKSGATNAAILHYHFTGSDWKIDANFSHSVSRSWYRDLDRGHWDAVNTRLQSVSTVSFSGIAYQQPAVIDVRDAANAAVAFNDLGSYRIESVRTRPVDAKAHVQDAALNVKRELGALPFPASLKVGVALTREDKDNRRRQADYAFVGRDGDPDSGDDGVAPFLDAEHSKADPFYGFRPIQWPDPFALARLFATNPEQFTPVAGGATAEINRINGSERIEEIVSAAYLQGEARFFSNRLGIVTGVRFEKTKDEGEGALFNADAAFLRNANGTFATTPTGARIRKTEADAIGSLAEVTVTRSERGYRASRAYAGFYPSLHATLKLTENLVGRFAYARSLGRPDFLDIIPNTIVDDADTPPRPGQALGSITVRNSGLLPWQAHNWDLALEYYFARGGVISAGVFRKDLTNFWGLTAEVLTPELAAQLDIDPAYVGYIVRTKLNSGSARITGAEANFVQQLDFVPVVGKYFSFNANGTVLHLEGENNADFDRFIPKSGSAGLTFTKRPIIVMLKATYRGEQRIRPFPRIPGGQGYNYATARYNLDVNAEYQFSQHTTFFVNARNITNVPQEYEQAGPGTPAYSRSQRTTEFGVQYAIGIKGTF